MKFFAGTSGYSYREWKGSFYPKSLPAGDMLRYYSEHLAAVESNSTFLKMPTAAVLQAWASEVPANFKFAIKAPRRITHIKRLNDVDDAVQSLFQVAGTLKKRLGPILFQLPPNFKKDTARLSAFLKLLPPKSRAAFGFRHASWFDDEIFALLKRHKAALCIADEDDDLKVPFVATARWGYLRLRRPNYSPAKLKVWAKQVARQNWQDVFVFFKHDDKGKGPKLAARFAQLG